MRVTWHNGGTAGYMSYAGFVKEARAGVIVLSNCFVADVDGTGVAILKLLSSAGK